MTKNILVVDDDVDLRNTLAEQLLDTGDFDVFEAGDAAEAVAKIKGQKFDIMLFDINLPDADGRELVKVVREHGIHTPIIMLTARDTEDDLIRGLNSGANDYVSKPFRLGELIARINAQLRQSEYTDDAALSIGPYTFRPSEKVLETEEGRNIRLTEKETNILKFLYRANKKVVPREVLLEEVWGYTDGITTHTLETHIYRLRQKIELEGIERVILTASGGYRLA